VEFFREGHTGYEDSVFTVSGLTGNIRELLEGSFSAVWVEGEISNFKRHSSGHMYFSIKDPGASIACVLWRGRQANMLFQLRDGLHVKIFGRITVFEKYGKYQLDVIQIIPVGEGNLQQAFFELKQRLFEEGLFDDALKKPVPRFPRIIGVVTSPTGAALQDIISVIGRRFPCVTIVVSPARVQGDGAAPEIARAIGQLNDLGGVDVIIAGRGGGSLEDLWAFNEEIVARAVYDSVVPVVSAVGHEVDVTICDFAADVRAPTPSAAAELVVPDKKELLLTIETLHENMAGLALQQIAGKQRVVASVVSGYAFRSMENYVQQRMQQADAMAEKLSAAAVRRIEKSRASYEKISGRLCAMDPNSVLKRGYSITSLKSSGSVVTSSEQVESGDILETTFSSGQALSVVKQVLQEGGDT